MSGLLKTCSSCSDVKEANFVRQRLGERYTEHQSLQTGKFADERRELSNLLDCRDMDCSLQLPQDAGKCDISFCVQSSVLRDCSLPMSGMSRLI